MDKNLKQFQFSYGAFVWNVYARDIEGARMCMEEILYIYRRQCTQSGQPKVSDMHVVEIQQEA